MKLLFAIKGMDGASGGAERVLAQVTDGLIERGHEVVLLSFDAPGGRSFYPLNPRLRRIPLGIGRTDRPSTLAETLRRVPALRRTVQAERPDVAIGFMHSMYVPLVLALTGAGVPLVASEHNVPERYADRRLQYALLILAGLRADRVTVLSPAVKRLFPRLLHRRMIAITNPVTDPGDRRADPAGSNGPGKTLLSVGRLTRQKDHDTLTRAFGLIADEFPDWQLRIVGEGELRPDLERTIASLGLEQRVELAGAVRAIDREYLGAQLFVVPSRFESFGLVTGEALSFGLPAIGFADCPGTNELIDDGVNGVLVGAGDRVGKLAAALRSLMSDQGKRIALGDRGPESVRWFSPSVVVDHWERLLEEIATRPRAVEAGQGAR